LAHFAAILFFTGLLIALALVLDLTVRANWAEIVAALRGVPPSPERHPRARALAAPPPVGAPAAHRRAVA
jgi:hypothetical protein